MLLCLLLAARPVAAAVLEPGEAGVEHGVASFYANLLAGRPTASGEPYDPRLPTCAHRTLPFGTLLEVVVLETGAATLCRVNDRGPFARGRMLDVSPAVRRALGLARSEGVWRVRVEVLALGPG